MKNLKDLEKHIKKQIGWKWYYYRFINGLKRLIGKQ